MSIKLGDHRVVLEKSVAHATDEDDYGNAVRGRVYRELRWCLFVPARSHEGNDRGSPAISGAQLLVPPVTGTEATDIESADAILYPWTKHADGTYTGRRWEVLGEVGVWDESIECLLRRLT